VNRERPAGSLLGAVQRMKNKTNKAIARPVKPIA